ncbi:Membrane transporters of cations and cationic drugs [Paramagnetospirillum magneticum AMB-1]|uniref:Guanidinium exporter n=2 Tax=Paramagnetospirillum magneticum TaxID=84159 RepID=Q2W7T1_PARM1|nr:Membrane transporters of cations and cationic drugs [Paramagnetospirillum magneticum AMB-1]
MPRTAGSRSDSISGRAGTTRPFSPHLRDGPALTEHGHMPWIYLLSAGLLEIGWAVGLKYVDGLSRPLPLVLTGAAMVGSVVLLGMAVRTLPLGTAYAVWTGIGTVGTVIAGMILFAEPADALRLFCMAMIVAGILGLKLA